MVQTQLYHQHSMHDGHLDTPNWVPPTNHTNTDELTTNAGQRVHSNSYSCTAGPRGPVLLEDFQLIEKVAQFNRERQPERVVHARGMTAKGYFELTHDISHLSCADLFTGVGKRTPVATRLSTVIHEKGSPETLRDVRGFATKFYTQEGNWDLVGNNFPVFFIRDGIQFPDLVHALKPNPRSHLQEGWRILDFLSSHPESTHILTWLLDDNGIPADWRSLEGFGVNTYTLVDAKGKETLVKFHWKPKDGPKFLTDDEAPAAGNNLPPPHRHSHATADLYNTIAAGEAAEWSFHIQTIDPEDQEKFEFDPLDDTKVWPEDRFPLQPVGKMILDTNVTNFHNESESIAFAPGIFVAGINGSNDRLLQSRMHAYADAQRYRIGDNYLLLPINQPKCPYHNNHNEGLMNFMIKDEEVNYWPSHVEHTNEHNAVKTTDLSHKIAGVRTREDIPKTNDFQQGGDRYRNLIAKDEKRKERFIGHIVSWMTEPKCNEKIRNLWYSHWKNVDADLGKIVEERVKAATSK